jgi:hypothetical protein
MMDWDTRLTRRMALAGMAAASVAGRRAEADSTPAAAPGAVTAQGTVFEDSAGTGRREADSQGVTNVMVSNGRDVVSTDADGRWSLPVREGDSIFVIKPTGWMTPLAPETHLPQFSYIYEPQGTPASLGLRYPGIAPTGPLPARIDFPLRRQAEPTRFNVVLFTDPQPESLNELGYVRDDVVAQAVGLDARFGITTGDIMFDDLSAYARSNRIVGTLGLPWYNCCGNHDMNYEAPDNSFSRETYKGVYGARYSAFQYGNVTFFLLDNVEYLGDHKYQGRFGADQLGFIRAVLAKVPADQLIDHRLAGVSRRHRRARRDRQLQRPHAYQRASLPDSVERPRFRTAASSSRALGGVRKLVERPLRCPRHPGGARHRRRAERLPPSVDRRRRLHDAALPGA